MKSVKEITESVTVPNKTNKNLASCRNKKGDNGESRVKRIRKPHKQKAKGDNWQCNSCQGFYFDVAHPNYDSDWVACIHCNTVRLHCVCAIGQGKFDNDDLDHEDFTCTSCFGKM